MEFAQRIVIASTFELGRAVQSLKHPEQLLRMAHVNPAPLSRMQ